MSKRLMTLGMLCVILCCTQNVWGRQGDEKHEPDPKTQEPVKADVADAADETGVGQGGEITWSWSEGVENWPADKVAAIKSAMDEAVGFYNRYARLCKHVTVEYDATVPTASANIKGHIRFGGSISSRTAMHELSHTLGVGTTKAYHRLLHDGVWTGAYGVSLIKAFDGPDAVLHGDKKHIWPYGLNYARQDSPIARIRHVKMIEAINWDIRAGHLMDAKTGDAK
ncbi:MAG: hypothetical protein GC164_11275 [Phycisphaera sp.]|nr:hypothetical protein [Phycisphaera sp.]